MRNKTIEDFGYKKLNHEQEDRIRHMRTHFMGIAELIKENLWANRERSIAYRHLQESCMWALKSISMECDDE